MERSFLVIADAISIPIDPVARREEWLSLRSKDVTASDVAAIWGASPHKTALALWAEKSGKLEKFDTENAFARRGRHLEPAILSAAGECPEFKGDPIARAKDYWRSPSLRLGATPDAYLETEAAAEPIDAKSVASWVFDRDWDGGPPLHIQMQVAVQAMLMNAPRAWVACAVMTPDFPVYIYEIKRNADAEAKMLAGVREFWRAVDEGEMPSPVAKDNNTLAAMFNKVERIKPLDWTSDDEAHALLLRHAELQEELTPLNGEIAEVQAKIKARLGTCEGAEAAGFRVSWKMQTRKAYEVKESTYRVLRIKAYTPDGEEIAA